MTLYDKLVQMAQNNDVRMHIDLSTKTIRIGRKTVLLNGVLTESAKDCDSLIDGEPQDLDALYAQYKKSMPSELDQSDRPTMEQVDRLEKLGFACPNSSSAAEKLLTAYQNRVDKGLASPKQIRFFKSRGFQNVENWTFAQGEKLIKRFIISHWRMPAGIDPATYRP